MLSTLLAICSWGGMAVSALVSVGKIITDIMDVVSKFLSQSKIYFTVLFVGIAIICFLSMERFIDWSLDILGVSGLFENSVTYGFVTEVVDISPILSLGRYYLSYWLTEKVFLSGIIGTRILYWFTMGFSNMIHL